MKNTKNNGRVRFLIFREKDGDYCAVCLDFDLIEWGTDKNELFSSIKEAADSYLKGVIQNNLPDELLNRPAPSKYWKMLEDKTDCIIAKPTRSNATDLKPTFFGFENKPYNDSLNFT